MYVPPDAPDKIGQVVGFAGAGVWGSVHKRLGGCRDKVKVYASTFPNMGSVEDYAEHAAACKAEGYTHCKIHPYYFWDLIKKESGPGRPSHVEQDIEVCRSVRQRVGNDMVLNFDLWGTYCTLRRSGQGRLCASGVGFLLV